MKSICGRNSVIFHSTVHSLFPMTVDSEKIKATQKDGILQILIPKKEEARVKPMREIKIS